MEVDCGVEGAAEAARQLQGGSLEMRNSIIQNRIVYLVLCCKLLLITLISLKL